MELTVGLILSCISFLLFIIYNSIAIGIFGVPWSLSKTYYLYEEKKKGLGWVFTIFMWIMAFTIMPCFLIVSEAVGPWMSYLSVFGFITAACIAFVGTAPRYRLDLEGNVHNTAATTCAISALLWDFLVCWNIWWVPLCGAAIAAIIGLITKTWKECRDYWLEMLAFDATFATIIFEIIVQILK